MALPYTVNYKLPLEYLTLQEWNNFIQNLLFLNQYGSAQLLQYFQNGSFQNLNEVIAKYLSVASLKINGYNALHNLSEPEAYTFGTGNQQPFESMTNKPTISFPYSIPFEFMQFYPITNFPSYQFPVFPTQNLQVLMSQISKQLQLLIPNLISKITVPNNVAGTQFQFSGSATVQNLIQNYFDPSYLQTWREITIQNLGNNAVQINNAIYLMPKQCLKITASSPSEIQLTAQNPTLLSEIIEFTGVSAGTPVTAYTITITNNQPDPTPSPFQQLLNLNLSSILSSSSQLLNLQFCLDVNCNTPLYAWIEQNNLTNAYIWVKIPTSIPANGSLTIYMFIQNSIQYPYTGIAPYLTSTYAQYDNGENVFNFYDNFAGTTLSSKWVTGVSGGTYTVNNGLTLNIPAVQFDYVYVASASAIANIPIIVESYMNVNSPNISGIIYGFGLVPSQTHLRASGQTQDQVSWQGTEVQQTEIAMMTQVGSSYNIPGGVNPADSNYHIWGFAWLSGEALFWYDGYSPVTSSTTDVPTDTNYLTLSYYAVGIISGTLPNLQFYWVRTRAYPPNGVMPSNSQPQQTIVFAS